MKQVETYLTLDEYFDSIRNHDHKVPNVAQIGEIGEEEYRYDRIVLTEESNPALYAFATGAGWNYTSYSGVTNNELGLVTFDELIPFLIGNTALTSFDEFKYFDGITEIPKAMFLGCSSVHEITIPASVKRIEVAAYDSFPSDVVIRYEGNISDIEFVYENRGELVVCYSGVTSSTKLANNVSNLDNKISYAIISGASNMLVIPGGEGNLPATFGSNTGITIEDVIYVIYSYKDSNKVIDAQTFYGCGQIKDVSIPGNVTSIGNSAFTNCTGLSSIEFGSGLTEISGAAFYGCTNLVGIAIPDNVVSIRYSAFTNCTGLETVEFGSGLTGISSCCFYACSSLEEVTIPDNVTYVGSYCFYGCSGLTGITIGSGITEISFASFYNCTSLSEIRIPDNVSIIAVSAFTNCTGLERLYLGSGMTRVSACTFANCSNLNYIYSDAATAPTIASTTFSGVSFDGILDAPIGADYSAWLSNNVAYLGYYRWVNIARGVYFEKSNIVFPEESATTSITVFSSSEWTASTEYSWLSVSPLTGSSGETTITINVSAPESARTGAVNFVTDECASVLLVMQNDKLFEPLTFNVSQAGALLWKASGSSIAKTISYKVNDGEWTEATSTTGGTYIGRPAESGEGGTYEVTGRGDTYGFVFNNETGYYESNNENTTYTSANCRVNLSLSSTCKVTFHYLCSGYSGTYYNRGVFGMLDAPLGTGSSSVNEYATASFTTTEETVTYIIESPGEHFIDVKYAIYYVSSSYAKLQFRVTVEDFPIPILKAGDVVQIVGDNASYANSSYCNYFSGNCQFSAHGNIMSLIDSSDYAVIDTLSSGYTFRNLFMCTGLTSAENLTLPATKLTERCYSGMFSGCTSLTTAPSLLPATTLASSCYYYMFSGCTSLTTAPVLPATILADNCYYVMFIGCTSLTTAPELPATTLANNCYDSMFYGCTSLTTSPSLPATTLANQCYSSMFRGCTSLTQAPELPATTLATSCYYNMFYGCTNLVSGVTSIGNSSTTIPASACCYMFQGCTSLTEAPELPATTLANYCYSSMFYNCTSLTTAPELPATTLASGCYIYMFQGCSSLTEAPALPATTLASSCYQGMFSACTSLTTAPELPATTLVSDCYYYMFQGCSKLNSIVCLATDISATNCTNGWVQNVASSGTFIKHPNMNNWTSDISGIPSNWTIQDAVL